MIFKITLKPSVALAESLFIKSGFLPKTTNYTVEVENAELNLTETERTFLFHSFIEGDGHTTGTTEVEGVVDSNFGHMPTTHEQALRCWLDYAGAYYIEDPAEI